MKAKIYSSKITDLVGYDRKIIQDDNFLAFSLDSLILANFVTINTKVKKILDLGTGIAPIPLILSLRTNARIDGVEIQEEVTTIARENIKINNLQKQISQRKISATRTGSVRVVLYHHDRQRIERSIS